MTHAPSGHKSGLRDEAFGYDLAWRPTFLFYSAERGNLDNQMHQNRSERG
jgi:hypothetical protein